MTGAMPKSLHDRARSDLHDIWTAETGKEADAALGLFAEIYGVNRDSAVEKQARDRDELLCFYDFPCEHWKHIHAANLVESVFSTAENRTRKTRGCLR